MTDKILLLFTTHQEYKLHTMCIGEVRETERVNIDDDDADEEEKLH